MISRTLLATGLRDLVRRPLHTGLMVLGVALGVAVVVAIDLANESARRGFSRGTQAVVGRATHQVVGGPSGLPEDAYRRIRVEAGLRTAAPVVDATVLAVDLGRRPLRLLGLDPFAEAPFREHAASGALRSTGVARLLRDRRAVLVGDALAERHGLSAGSTLRVQVDDRVETLTVAGLVRASDPDERLALEGLLLMDVGGAQELLRQRGRLARVDLIATPEEAERVARLLPAGARLVEARGGEDAALELTAAFRLNLTALSLLALVVGTFLIYNTVMFGVVQRRTVLGTLRALGVTSGEIAALVLVETAVAAGIGSLLGVGLGWLLGQGAVRLVTRTINDLYFVLSVTGAPLTARAALEGILLGITSALVAAAAPAVEAARVEPVTMLRPSVFESRSRRLVPWVAAAGGGLAAAGAALLAVSGRSLVGSFAGLFGIVVGLALVTPAATVALMRLAAPGAAFALGTLGRLATRTVTRAVSRTGVAVAALMVAISVTIGVGLMIASFRTTVANWLDLSLRADLFVAAPAAGGTRRTPTLSPDVADRVAAVPGVAEVETFRAAHVGSTLGEVQLSVVDGRRLRSAALYRFAEGTPADTWERLGRDAVVVSEPFAYRHSIPARGGAVTLRTDRGDRVFPVAGIFYDYATERGLVLMRRDVYERFWDDRGVSSLGLYVAEGADLGTVADAVRAALPDRSLQVTPNRALRAHALRVFDRTFAVTDALRVLAVVVAFIGVWSALLALQAERIRELATLQALGLTPGGLWRLALLETGLMGAAAGLLSMPTGLLLAVVLIHVINVRSFGWTMQLVPEPWLFVQALGISVVAALLAAVYPTVRLLRMPIASALRQE